MLKAPLALLSVLIMSSVNAQTAPSVDAIQADIANKQTEYDSFTIANGAGFANETAVVEPKTAIYQA